MYVLFKTHIIAFIRKTLTGCSSFRLQSRVTTNRESFPRKREALQLHVLLSAYQVIKYISGWLGMEVRLKWKYESTWKRSPIFRSENSSPYQTQNISTGIPRQHIVWWAQTWCFERHPETALRQPVLPASNRSEVSPQINRICGAHWNQWVATNRDVQYLLWPTWTTRRTFAL